MNNLISVFPPVAAVLLLVAAGLVFVIGFSRHGMNFIKYGFKQTVLDSTLEERFDRLEAKLDSEIGSLRTKLDSEIGSLRTKLDSEIGSLGTKLDSEIGGLRTELESIKVNHFGHLKDFLTELTSILVDKNVINNQDKARLDNKLRGM
ncbi:MAG: CCDC90 family protein [Treponema sp.]|nr:CCDC90 family protein [Treponema sp.]